jgi:hypothetical protein
VRVASTRRRHPASWGWSMRWYAAVVAAVARTVA